ncbi:MAG: archaellin/type IV pilin N-terminal domain-containing protein [Nitrososphaera sp.]|jgi:phosphate transport system substrate-binding protein
MVSNKTSNRRAVSPIVAVLILIVVAVVGGGAVAVLMGNITSQTSQQASSQAVANKSSSVLNIGGSTTVFPITEAVKGNFTASSGIAINDAQGGSGAGMVGVDQGVLDIGAASSIKAYTDEVAKDPTANLKNYLIGGSGITIIAKGSSANVTFPGGILAGANTCAVMPSDIAKTIFTANGGTFNGHSAYWDLTCNAQGLVTAAVPTTVLSATSVHVYSRSDLPSGTADQWAIWISQSNSAKGDATNFNDGQPGNPNVFTAVDTTNTATEQALGFVDVGFDKTGNNAKDFVMGLQTSKAATGMNANHSPVVGAGQAIKPVEDAVKNSLKGTSQFPGDNTDATTQASRTFYYVTKGSPSASEQAFIDFVRSTSPIVTDAFHNLGYYSIYDFK